MRNTARLEKSLSISWLVSCIVVYLAIIQGTALFLTAGQELEYAIFPTTESIIRIILIPVGLSVVFLAITITWLGWWQRVLREKICLARWTWIVPALMVLTIVVVTNYSRLGAVNPIMALTLLGSVILIGIGEELMFRGVTLEALRGNGRTTELKAALLTAIIFGGAHITNIFIEGPNAFIQAVIVTTTGIFYYVALRVSGTILVPILLHAAWDFSLFSGNIGLNPDPSDLVAIALLTNLVLTIIVAFKWRTIWPSTNTDTD